MKHSTIVRVKMATSGKFQLSEATVNLVENLACRLAEYHGGKILPNHLIPYIPLSLAMIDECLDNMVDGCAVIRVTPAEGLAYYLFSAYDNAAPKEEVFSPRECIACGCDLLLGSESTFCTKCVNALKLELNVLAERTGWPAQAVYEHEILYLAARHEGPHFSESLAGRSRLTLRRMKKKLHILVEGGYINQALTEGNGLLGFEFPDITYPRNSFYSNMDLIETYPASLMEEMELKIVRIFLTLTGLVLGMFFVVFWFKLPYPLAIPALFISSLIVSWFIWRHKRRVIDD